MSLQRFKSLDLQPKTQESIHECWCCHDTGLIVETWEIRDESDYPFPSTLPSMACKQHPIPNRPYCVHLYRKLEAYELVKDDMGIERKILKNTLEQIDQAVQQRYDTSATRSDCLRLHQKAIEDAKTRQRDSDTKKQIKADLRAYRIGKQMPDATPEQQYSEQQMDAIAKTNASLKTISNWEEDDEPF